MKERHYQYLRNLTKLKDYAINMTHHIDSLYENFLRMSDEDKDAVIEEARSVFSKPTKVLEDYNREESINLGVNVAYDARCREVEEKCGPYVWFPFLWKAVRLINWPTLCQRYNADLTKDDDYDDDHDSRPYIVGQNILLHNGWTDDAIKKAGRELSLLSKELKTMWHGKVKSLKVGDDSWSDLVYHVIGCGPDAILAVMNDFELLHIYNEEKEESFSYCFCV